MSHITIVCATTESKSRKSKKTTIKPVMELFQKFEFLYGPANHPTRTPEKHKMALSQAIAAKKTHMSVMLILIVPENQGFEHLPALSQAAIEADIEFDIISLGTLTFIADCAKISKKMRQWNKPPQ